MRHILIAATLLMANSAFAVPVTWTLQDVYLSNGVQLTGSFVYDADAPLDSCMSFYGGIYPDCDSPFDAYASQEYSAIYIETSQPIYANDGASVELDINDGSAQYDRHDYPPSYGVSSANWLQVNGNHSKLNGVETYTRLRLLFEEALTNSGGIIQLGDSDWNPDPYCCSPYNFDIPITGSVVANVIPIPAAAWLFGSALAGLGWMRRKQTV